MGLVLWHSGPKYHLDHQHPIKASVLTLAAPSPTQIPENEPINQWEVAKVLGTRIHVGDLGERSASWLQPVPGLAAAAVWELARGLKAVYFSL